MNSIKFIKTFLVLALLLSVLQSCSKDDFTTGTVKITYAFPPNDLSIEISPVENPQIAISGPWSYDKQGAKSYNLNIGNYLLTSKSSEKIGKVGFQIRAGHTTVITFDTHRKGTVQY